jgi:2-polyprenyl-6-methoxyphenol hydroxylase-like FAD-dependent oxidoreductase
METHSDTQVLIAGAGPTGLTLACELARHGVAFRIVDAAPRHHMGSRGKGLQPRSLEVLDDLGVVDRALAAGRFHMTFRGYDGATVLGEWDWHEGRLATPNVPYASTLLIPQWRVEEILRARLASLGGGVELATELTGFSQDSGGVVATLVREAGTERVGAGFLVGCDGGHSVVRRTLGIPFEGETNESLRMLVGDVEARGLDRDHWHAWPKAKDGPVALCPLPGTNLFQFQAMVTGDDPVDPSLETFQKVFDERTGRSDIRLRGATWLSLYRANVRMAARYRVDRVFLAGDAAHVHPPAGGQGMNTGIQDAYNLGWKLGRAFAGAGDALLDSYEEERLPIAASLLGLTSKMLREGTRDNAAKSRGPETLQLDLNYRGSSLASDDRGSTLPVRAGDRAPDAPCHTADGAPKRLFDLFRGPHFTLLAFGETHASLVALVNARHGPLVQGHVIVEAGHAKARHALVDSGAHARTGYAVHGETLILVRPDGYIGWIASPGTADGLDDYLRRAGAVPAAPSTAS